MKQVTISIPMVLLAAIYIVILTLPISKSFDYTYFEFLKNFLTPPDEGIGIIYLIPFATLLITTFLFIRYHLDKDLALLEKARVYSLITFIGFVVINIMLGIGIEKFATEKDENLNFLIGAFPYLLLSFSNILETAVGKTKIWFNEPEERPNKKWFSAKAITLFVWAGVFLFLFFVITSKMGCNWDNKKLADSYKDTTVSDMLHSFPTFLFGSTIVYFAYVIYRLIKPAKVKIVNSEEVKTGERP